MYDYDNYHGDEKEFEAEQWAIKEARWDYDSEPENNEWKEFI